MRKETLALIRVPTDEMRKFIRARSHKTDSDPAWAKLHRLLSDHTIDEFERGMFEGYAKRFARNKKLSERERAWLERRTDPGFDVAGHRARMLDLGAHHHTQHRNGSMRLCVDCGLWDPEEDDKECAHNVILFHDVYATKAATGLANRIVSNRKEIEMAQKALRELVLGHCIDNRAEYENDVPQIDESDNQ